MQHMHVDLFFFSILLDTNYYSVLCLCYFFLGAKRALRVMLSSSTLAQILLSKPLCEVSPVQVKSFFLFLPLGAITDTSAASPGATREMKACVCVCMYMYTLVDSVYYVDLSVRSYSCNCAFLDVSLFENTTQQEFRRSSFRLY